MLTVVSTSSLELFLQPIHSGASCLSCCLIYKVHTALSGGLLSYHSSFPLSSTFSSFFKLFRALIRGLFAVLSAILADSLIMLPHSVSLVKHFFQAFSNFFVPVREDLRWSPPSSRTAHRGYHFWNLLSSTFFKFSKLKFKHRPSRSPLRFPQTLLLQGFLKSRTGSARL